MYIEFCGGGAVDGIMVDLEKGLNENQIRYVCHEMCQGLAFIHRQHVIHRDLKAGNVLLTVDGAVKLGEVFVTSILSVQNQVFFGKPFYLICVCCQVCGLQHMLVILVSDKSS